MTSPLDLTEGQRPSLDSRLLRRRSRRNAGAPPPRTIPSVPHSGPLPLSSGQRRFLLLHEVDQTGDHAAGTGNFAFWLRLRGPLDTQALHRALDELCRRHEVLRTVYGRTDGVPVQTVREHMPTELAVHDFGAGPDPEGRARAAARTMARQPFRLTDELPVRWDLLRLGERDHVLLLRIHHIAADGWSEGVLNRELSVLYGAFRDGEPSPLLPLAVQYADYAVWQQDRLDAGRLDGQLDYWRGALAGPPPVTELPFDRAPTATAGTAGTVLALPVDPAAGARLAALCAGHGVSLFQALLAGYATLLTRYSGQTDVVVGVPVAGRGPAETTGLIGFFVNTIALRVDTSGSPTFGELLRRVRDVALDGVEHQEAPFEQVVEQVAPPRQPGRQPLVQTMLQVHNTPYTALELAGLDVEQEQLFTDSTSADLAVSFVEDDGLLVGMWEFRTELFDADTVRRIHEDLFRLLEEAAAHPERSVADLELLPQEDRARLRTWSRGPRRTGEPQDVLARFGEQARRTPGKPAVICGADRVTYAELDRMAGVLADRLRGEGVADGDLVGICLERSVDMVVSVLAVLRAGAAYLPLDPGYPAQRLRFMLDDAAPALVLTQDRTAASLGRHGVPELRTDRVRWDTPPAGPARADHPRPQDLAYVIYTSGSTGTPKGVAVPHGGLANYLSWAGEMYRTSGDGGSVLHSSLSFDLTVTSFFLPLLHGHPVVVVADVQPLPQLAALLTDPGNVPAVVKLTPSHLQALRGEAAAAPSTSAAASDAARSADAITAFVVGGEALPADLVTAWRQLAPRGRFFNEYGPTEAVVGCCVHEVTADQEPDAPVPIGTPVDNTELYVLDRHGNQVRPGALGELYIGGSQVVRGYLNRRALTAERFVPDPFGGVPGSRLYRTGDLVRHLPNGELELIGRTDDQVKIRGRRVETGEVAASLRSCPGVADAVVVVGGAGAAELVGYYVAESGPDAPVPEDLREALARTLPEHMVPSVVVLLGALPLTENGKVDRAALPDPGPSRARTAPSWAAPANAVEAEIAAIWARTLRLPAVGALDNFFELGGHSLLASSVVEQLGRVWPRLPARGLLRQVFLHPKLRDLATAVAELLAAVPERSDPPATARPVPGDRLVRPGPLPLSPAQESLLVQVELSGGPHEYLVPVAVHLTGPLDVEALRGALRAVVDRHEVLRCRFPRDASDHCFALSLGQDLPLTRHDVTVLAAGERAGAVAALLHTEVTTPLDLAQGPLLRALLVRDAADSHLLCLTTHHLVFDGRSQQILLSELTDAYAAALEGDPPSLAELPGQYADLADELGRAAAHPADEDLAYWTGELAATPPLRLPADRPRATRRSGAGAALTFTVPADTTAGLRRLAGDRSATPFMVLLAGLQCLLSRHSGQTDFAVGTSVAGRNLPGSAGLIGMFVNQLALRAHLGGDLDFGTLLERVRDRCTEAFARQDVPFDRVVREVRPERVPGAHPLFQVAMELADAPWDEDLATGLAMREHPVPVTVSKFDLTVAFRPEGDRLIGEMEYDVTLYDEGRVRGLADDLLEVLETVARAPQTPVAGLLPHLGADTPADEPAAPQESSAGDPLASASDAELLVADAYRAVLPAGPDGAEVSFGPDDDFFGIGGHSVLALRVVSRLRRSLGIDLPLDLMFQHPTVRGLAGRIETLLLDELDALSDEEAVEALEADRTSA